MITRHIKKLAVVVNGVNFTRVTENSAFTVAQNRPLFPTALQQFVDNLQVLIGVVVARIMRRLRLLADIARPAFQIGGNNVPAHAPFGQVVQGRQATGKGIRMFKRQRRGKTKAQMLRHQCHWRDQRQRILYRYLSGLANGCITVTVVHVIDAQHIGNKQAVELATLKQARQIDPIIQVFILPGPIARMGPKPRRLVADAVHVEGVETNFTL